MRIFNQTLTPLKSFLFFALGVFIEYLGYISYRHITHFSEIMAGTYSSGGKILNVILWPVALLTILAAVVVFFILASYFFRYLIIAIQESPKIIRNEVEVIKRIWNNRGIGKYRLFGGLTFYLKLRQRVLAYFLAFLCIGIVTWYFAFRQHTYEKTYWNVHFYYNEPTPVLIFKPNISYTFESSADLYSIRMNGLDYIVGKHMDLEDDPRVLSLLFPNKWHVKFPDTARMQFVFYQDHINEIFSQSFEVWENKEEGLKVTLNDFVLEKFKKHPNTKRYTRN